MGNNVKRGNDAAPVKIRWVGEQVMAALKRRRLRRQTALPTRALHREGKLEANAAVSGDVKADIPGHWSWSGLPARHAAAGLPLKTAIAAASRPCPADLVD
ncbi:hypothetical protein ACPYPG_34480 [Streptomyces sp. FR-108]|uniref:hypothetical protein n=1 Tax=Streptomyces sp. FR-108 TaxID=3416665 RepID=UPI003CF03F25